MNNTITFTPSLEVEALLKDLQDLGYSTDYVLNRLLEEHLDELIESMKKRKEAT